MVDIPLLLSTDIDCIGADSSGKQYVLQYTLPLGVRDVVLFYKQEMDYWGWNEHSHISATQACFVYVKPTRECIIIIRPRDDGAEVTLFIDLLKNRKREK